MDGLDEATGGEVNTALLPPHPPAGLRVLLSARQTALLDAKGWSRQIGWALERAPVRYETVAPLTSGGAAELLSANGLVLDETTANAIVTALVGSDDSSRTDNGLTRGEPLLLQLYAEELAERQAKGEAVIPEMLAGLKPGYGAYFQNWLSRQETAWVETGHRPDDRWKAVLALLASAAGPLLNDDLEVLVERVLGQRVVVDNEVIGWVQRFVLNDGLTSGYVLAQPLLAEFLKDKAEEGSLVRGGWIVRAERAFLEWGHDALAKLSRHKLAPAKVPPYLLKFFGQHLQEAGAPAGDFMSFVEEGWLRAWEAFEEGYRGFSEDVKRARNAAEKRSAGDQPSWAWQLRCQLVLSSIASLGSQIRPELLAECIKCDLLSPSQAIYWLQYEPLGTRTEAFAILAPHLTAAPLPQALDIARAIERNGLRAQALIALAPRLPETERLDVLAEALGSTEEILNTIYGAEAFDALASQLPADLLPKALDMARAIEDDETRALALIALAPRFPGTEREDVLAEVLDAARSIGEERDRALTLATLAPQLPAALLPKALDMARAIEEDECRAWALVALAAPLAETEREDVLAAATGFIQETLNSIFFYGAGHFGALARPAALLPKALDMARAIEDDETRAQALIALAPHFPGTEREDVLAEVLDAARSIGEERDRASTLATLARQLPPMAKRRTDALVEAVQIIWAIEDSSDRAMILADLAPELSSNRELLTESLQSARAIAEDADRSWALSRLAPYLPKAERVNALTEALRAAKAIGDGLARVQHSGCTCRLPARSRATRCAR